VKEYPQFGPVRVQQLLGDHLGGSSPARVFLLGEEALREPTLPQQTQLLIYFAGPLAVDFDKLLHDVPRKGVGFVGHYTLLLVLGNDFLALHNFHFYFLLS
jgi:hypothetical protein